MFKGRARTSPSKNSHFQAMRANKLKDTKPELLLRKTLYERGFGGIALTGRLLLVVQTLLFRVRS